MKAKKRYPINPEWKRLGKQADCFGYLKDAFKCINTGPTPKKAAQK